MSEMLRRVVGMMTKRTYATWNPADKGGGLTLSGGNLVATSNAAFAAARATIGVSSGKWYWEVVLSGSGSWFLGVATTSQVLTTPLSNPNATGVQSNNYYWNSGGSGAGSGWSFGASDIIGFALDANTKVLNVYLNNTLITTISSVQSGTIYPAISNYSGTENYTANFGATPFNYTPPVGYNPGVY